MKRSLSIHLGYEQLAVDLTAVMAQKEPDCNVRNALNFALLEDFDHFIPVFQSFRSWNTGRIRKSW